MKRTVILAVKLFLIAAIATAVLAVVNNLTSPIVAKREKADYDNSLSKVFSEADNFKSLQEVDKKKFDKIVGENNNIDDIVYAYSGEESVGYVFKVIGTGGYGGDITFVIGVDNESTIVGYEVLVHSETKGFGSQVTEEPFISSVVGNKMDKELEISDSASTDYDIQAISGTTISVKAILSGLNGAVKALAELGS